MMPFGLKNVGATYQRLVNKEKLGRNMEVYVDDMLVKSRNFVEHSDDLEEAFVVIQKYRMILNLKKCTFRVLTSLLANDNES